MKLSRINVVEGTSSDVIATIRAKLRSKLAARDITDPQLRQFVEEAKRLDVSLLQNSLAATKWWDQLLTHYSIPREERQGYLTEVLRRIRPRIEQITDGSRTKQIMQLLAHHTNSKNTSGKALKQYLSARQRLIQQQRRDFRESTELSEGPDWSKLLNKAMDFTAKDPNQRGSRQMAIKAQNEQIAFLAIDAVQRIIGEQTEQALRNNDLQKAAAGLQRLGEKVEPPAEQATPQQNPQEIATILWKVTIARAAGKKVDSNKVRALLKQLDDQGLRVQWRGKKTSTHPNGDQPPQVVKK